MLATLLRHDRAIVLIALAAVVVAAWGYLLAGAAIAPPAAEADAGRQGSAAWTFGRLALVFVMWAVMMAAMMLPSAAPTLLLHDRISRGRNPSAKTSGRTGVFGLGYLAVWAVFSVGATALQYGLAQAAFLSPAMRTTHLSLAGGLLIAAGIYQLTPLKQACLRRCRSPFEFLTQYWRGGHRGAFAMGVRHGAFCLGCCWLLMLLLFVGGVMNVIWIAGIALFVAIEKLAPRGSVIGYLAAGCLIAWGIATLVAYHPSK